MNKEFLMTFDEYRRVASGKVSPYTYVIERDNRYLYYFGSIHSFNPEDAQFLEIKGFFDDFVSKTGGKERIVLIEGGKWEIRENTTEAITKGSEAGYLAYLAAHAGIDRVSPEPREKVRFAELEKRFSHKEIVYHDFARMVYQWNKLVDRPDFDHYIAHFLEIEKYHTAWDDIEFSVEYMRGLHKKFFEKDFDPNDYRFFRSITNPMETGTAMNALARFEGEKFRDLHILGEIERLWNAGKSIFIIYGMTHAIRQEPALRTLI